MGILYLGHPAASYDGDPAELVDLWVHDPSSSTEPWTLRKSAYCKESSLNAQDFSSRVLQQLGPVVLLEPIQARSRQEIMLRLGGRVPVIVAAAYSSEELSATINIAISDFEAGLPNEALDVVVALLLMQKLERELMWAGNAKGYMWNDLLAKGRGLDEKYACRLPVVISVLLNQGGFLVFKTSKGKRKYALNSAKRIEIYSILKSRIFPPLLQASLVKHAQTERVRVLDENRVGETND